MPSTVLQFPGRAASVLSPNDSAPEATAAERRAYLRRPAEEILWLEGIRLKYGPAVRVIDVSQGGAQIETADYRLTPGQTVVCEIVSGAHDLVIPARVVRCQVSRLSPCPNYRGSLAFKRTLDLPALDPAVVEGTGEPDPAAEHRRLTAALRRRAAARDEAEARASTAPEPDALSATLALIEGPAARRAGKEFARELSCLFRTLAHGLDLGEPPDALRAALQRRLLRVLPVRSIEMVAELTRSAPEDSLYFSVAMPAGAPAKVLVQFLEQQPLTDEQFQLLKAAAHLFALVHGLDDPRPSPAPVPAPPPPEPAPAADVRPPQPLYSGVRVVVRYTDGRLVKGYCRDFLPDRGYVEIVPSDAGAAGAFIRVPFGSLKAIFFVRDFAGDPHRVDAEAPGAPGRGRPVTVTFLDDEVLRGTTMNYQPSGPGFFVTPRNDRANNERVFVVSRAIRHVQFA